MNKRMLLENGEGRGKKMNGWTRGLVVSLGAKVDYRTSYDSLGHDLMVRGGMKQVWWDDSKKPDECQVCQVPGASVGWVLMNVRG